MMLHLLMYLSINLSLSQATGHIKIQYICNSLWCSLWDAFELVIELTQGMIKKMMQNFGTFKEMQKFWEKNSDCLSLRKMKNRLIFVNVHFSYFLYNVSKREN